MAKIERKFTTEIKQAEGKGWDRVGQSYEGTFTERKDVLLSDDQAPGGKRPGTLIMLNPDEGDTFGVWANAVLADLMSQVDTGKYVRITYTADGPKKGKKSPTKLFKVQVAE